MPFCPNCGREVPRGAVYCPFCGSQVRRGAEEDWKVGTGLDLLMMDREVQWNWGSRLVAYIIDSIIVGVTAAVIGWLLTFPLIIGALINGRWWTWRGVFGLPLSMGVVQVLYFTLIEGGYGASIGKQFMGLKVVDAEGNPPSFMKALIRNISKVYWALLLLDILIGLLSRFDPRQKYTDQIAGTKVISLRGRPPGAPAARRPAGERRYAPPPRKRDDPLGGVSAGVILIILASVFILHPGIPSEVLTWLRGWEKAGPAMIPTPLIQPLIWLLSALGVWSLALAVIRVVSGVNRREGVSDAFGGAFMLTAAFLLKEYVSRLMPLTVLLPLLVIALGVFIFLSSAVSYLMHDRL
ncbi:hypothetical protein DRO42_01305 [Candidatus Bathyarchaeota archaeon]|nr:MAG: hypothetical protein DRO42_01305 [Candidatus Bathyarchaeota archaeon]